MEKLVRDRIPEIIRASGATSRVRRAERGEYIGLLRNKLVEEAHEALSADTPADTLQELADVYEVVLSLAAALGFTPADVEDARRRKYRERGGFSQAFVLELQRSADQ